MAIVLRRATHRTTARLAALAGAMAVPLDPEGMPVGRAGGLPWWGYAGIAAGAIALIGLAVGLLAVRRSRKRAVVAQPPPAVLPGASEPVPVAPAVSAVASGLVPPVPEPPPEPAALVFTDGPFAGRRVEVEHELVLGREDVDVLVEDPEVSRRHASVRPVDGGLEIDDLGSSNGTFVNGVRVRETKLLRHGDEIRLGGMSMRVDVPPRAQATVMAQTQGNPGFPHEPSP